MQISFFNLLWVFSFLVGLVLFRGVLFVCVWFCRLAGWLLFGGLFVCVDFLFSVRFWLCLRSSDILIIPSIKKLHHCRREKQLPQRATETYLKQGGKGFVHLTGERAGDGASDLSEGDKMDFVPLHV